jgi:hypothetical protein
LNYLPLCFKGLGKQTPEMTRADAKRHTTASSITGGEEKTEEKKV